MAVAVRRASSPIGKRGAATIVKWWMDKKVGRERKKAGEMEAKQRIEIALRAGRVAKAALEFTEGEQTSLLFGLRYKNLVDEMNGLRETVLKAMKKMESGS